jgi:hypothetical protein
MTVGYIAIDEKLKLGISTDGIELITGLLDAPFTRLFGSVATVAQPPDISVHY